MRKGSIDPELAAQRAVERQMLAELVMGSVPFLIGLANYVQLRRARAKAAKQVRQVPEALIDEDALAEMFEREASADPVEGLEQGPIAAPIALEVRATELARLLGGPDTGWTAAVAGDGATVIVRFHGDAVATVSEIASYDQAGLAGLADQIGAATFTAEEPDATGGDEVEVVEEP